MPSDVVTATTPASRLKEVIRRRGGEGNSENNAAARQARKHLHELFAKIEHEFEKVYSENLSLQDKIEQLSERLDSYAGGDKVDTAAVSVAGEELVLKPSKKGSQFSQKIKSTYKTSTTRLANTFRTSGCGRLVRDFLGHTDGVWDISAVSRHGVRLLASASADYTAKVWSIDTGLVVLEYYGHRGSVNSIRFHPFKSLVVSGSGDQTAHIWAALLPVSTSDTPVTTLPPSSSVTPSYAHPTSDCSLASPEEEDEADRELDSYEMHDDACAVSENCRPKERTVPDEDGAVARHREAGAAAGARYVHAPLASLRGHGDVVSAADWLCDGSRVVTASWDGTAAAHDVERAGFGCGETIVEMFTGHERELTNVSTHASQKLVLTTSKDMSVRLWDLRLPAASVNALLGHSSSVSSAVFAPSDRIISGSDDRTVKLWDMKNMAAPYMTIRSDSAINRLSVCQSTGVVAVPHDNRHIRLYEGATGVRLGRMPHSSRTGHSRMVCATAWLEVDAGSVGAAAAGSGHACCNLFSAGFDGHALGWHVSLKASEMKETGAAGATKRF